MSEQATTTAGATTEAPAGATTTTTQTKEESGKGAATTTTDVVSRADLQRALDDLHRFKKEAETLRAEQTAQRDAKMKAENQWKEYAETKEREAKEATEKAKKLQDSFLNNQKYNALMAKTQALGILPAALSDLESLDLEDIRIETTSTGKINVLGVDVFAERIKSTKPHWFGTPAAPNVNASGQRVQDNPSTVTAKMVMDAERDGKKTGDMSTYHKLLKQFQTQKR